MLLLALPRPFRRRSQTETAGISVALARPYPLSSEICRNISRSAAAWEPWMCGGSWCWRSLFPYAFRCFHIHFAVSISPSSLSPQATPPPQGRKSQVRRGGASFRVSPTRRGVNHKSGEQHPVEKPERRVLPRLRGKGELASWPHDTYPHTRRRPPRVVGLFRDRRGPAPSPSNEVGGSV